jgi:hypothetical protein
MMHLFLTLDSLIIFKVGSAALSVLFIHIKNGLLRLISSFSDLRRPSQRAQGGDQEQDPRHRQDGQGVQRPEGGVRVGVATEGLNTDGRSASGSPLRGKGLSQQW